MNTRAIQRRIQGSAPTPPLVNARVLLNPNAGGADASDALRDAIRATPDVELYVCRNSGDATRLAAEALADGCDLVVAVGGDGTINEVVNGLAGDFGGAVLGVIPLGTGNDLARTLALPEDPLEAFQTAMQGTRRPLDVIRVRSGGETAYALNVCAGGFTGEVNEVMTDELKETWGPLAYLIGAVKALPDLEGYETRIAWDEGPLEIIDALNVVVANGRTAAGGRPAAPRANPEDGLLDVVVIRNGSGAELAALAATALAGDYLESDLVVHERVRRLRVESRPGMWFNVDGELFTKEPVHFEALPGALRVVVGPGYSPEPPNPDVAG